MTLHARDEGVELWEHIGGVQGRLPRKSNNQAQTYSLNRGHLNECGWREVVGRQKKCSRAKQTVCVRLENNIPV